MKIIVLESSPHRHGASNTLAGYFIHGAKEAYELGRKLRKDIKKSLALWCREFSKECRTDPKAREE